jgi:hypothetical protein
MKYLKRVSSELEAIEGGPEAEELMLQGVRFAFRVHQVRTFLVMNKKPCFRSISRVVLNALYVLSSHRPVCWWVRRGHHACLPGAQGEGVHVPDTATAT